MVGVMMGMESYGYLYTVVWIMTSSDVIGALREHILSCSAGGDKTDQVRLVQRLSDISRRSGADDIMVTSFKS
jgi:hypothetical protein